MFGHFLPLYTHAGCRRPCFLKRTNKSKNLNINLMSVVHLFLPMVVDIERGVACTYPTCSLTQVQTRDVNRSTPNLHSI